MKKIGFTLTEVLITLGIIGVIAALTMPTLVQSGRDEANAAKLSVIVSSLENAFTTAITKEGVETLFETSMWGGVPNPVYKKDEAGNETSSLLSSGLDGDNSSDAAKAAFVGELNKYLVTSGYKNQNMTQYYSGFNTSLYEMTANGGQGAAVNSNNSIGDGNQAFPVLLKNGGVVFLRVYKKGIIERNENTIRAAGGSFYEQAADVFIDVNGANPPNVIGRDVFTFYLGQNGILYPAGGMDVSVFEHQDRTHVWSNTNSYWCCIAGHIQNSGWGCAARLIEEGYKMNY